MFVSMKTTSQISAGRVADDDVIEYSSSREGERRTGIELRSLEQPHSSYCGLLSLSTSSHHPYHSEGEAPT